MNPRTVCSCGRRKDKEAMRCQECYSTIRRYQRMMERIGKKAGRGEHPRPARERIPRPVVPARTRSTARNGGYGPIGAHRRKEPVSICGIKTDEAEAIGPGAQEGQETPGRTRKGPTPHHQTCAQPRPRPHVDDNLDGPGLKRQDIMHELKRPATLALPILRKDDLLFEREFPAPDPSTVRPFLHVGAGHRAALRSQLQRRAAADPPLGRGVRRNRHDRILEHADRRHDRGQPPRIFRRDSSSAARKSATPATAIFTLAEQV